MPPRSDRESYLAPQKKINKCETYAKNWYKCESNTECKNGRTLEKYGNLRLLIRIKQHRTLTRATQSVRLNREVREGILPPTLLVKTCHPGNVTGVSCPLISFNVTKQKCSIRYILCGTGLVDRCRVKINLKPF